jgi:hypothetical protein
MGFRMAEKVAQSFINRIPKIMVELTAREPEITSLPTL